MRGGGRMGQNRFCIAQIVGNHPDLQRVEETERSVLPPSRSMRSTVPPCPSATAPAHVCG